CNIMSKDLNRKNCRFCKKIIKKESEICFDCNTKNHNQNSDKILALSLCLFFGVLGIFVLYMFSFKAGFTFIFISILFFLFSTSIKRKKQD
uniref:TM2 domain-containing protein n=2 Tax=Borreliella garinii TaxID=29519 RepID=UPI001AEE0CF0